ncbi:SGNH/GDSL hydrolase family protein [Micromonospora sp. R77]|uniref:SGNH/GDSL hydrolase family protein n=1 Tax=Micromonospora sp. R77 TaxID=2925836 RepID=UPI001F601730|nr:SGNH/GDSL hydrolase family protein [Micromonospora sp. R77]MCI4066359.1 SGNH/GDSL hydrolase family protein [Micromonospora sp. R77]
MALSRAFMPERRAHLNAVVAACLALTVAGVAACGSQRVSLQPAPTVSSSSMVALGDSVPSGYGCACAGYVQSLANRITAATGREVLVHNDAQPGATSTDVADAVRDDLVSSDLAASDLVLIQVGANDLDTTAIMECGTAGAACYQPALQTLHSNLRRIIAAAEAGVHHPVVALIGYWNITVDGAVAAARGSAFTTASEQATDYVNQVINDVAKETAAIYVDTQIPLKGPTNGRDPTGDLQNDGDHPNASGNEIIADAAFRALQAAGGSCPANHSNSPSILDPHDKC